MLMTYWNRRESQYFFHGVNTAYRNRLGRVVLDGGTGGAELKERNVCSFIFEIVITHSNFFSLVFFFSSFFFYCLSTFFFLFGAKRKSTWRGSFLFPDWVKMVHVIFVLQRRSRPMNRRYRWGGWLDFIDWSPPSSRVFAWKWGSDFLFQSKTN